MKLEERLFSGRQPVNGGGEAGLLLPLPRFDTRARSHPVRRTEASCSAPRLSVV